MGTHRPSQPRSSRRGRRSNLVKKASNVIDDSLSIKDFDVAAKISTLTSFIDSDINEITTELIIGFKTYKEAVRNDWDLDINKIIDKNLIESQIITEHKFSSIEKNEISQYLKNYFKNIINSRKSSGGDG